MSLRVIDIRPRNAQALLDQKLARVDETAQALAHALTMLRGAIGAVRDDLDAARNAMAPTRDLTTDLTALRETSGSATAHDHEGD